MTSIVLYACQKDLAFVEKNNSIETQNNSQNSNKKINQSDYEYILEMAKLHNDALVYIATNYGIDTLTLALKSSILYNYLVYQTAFDFTGLEEINSSEFENNLSNTIPNIASFSIDLYNNSKITMLEKNYLFLLDSAFINYGDGTINYNQFLSNVYDIESNALEDTLISNQFSGWFVLMCAITRSSTELWYNAFNNDRHILHNFALSTHYPSSGGYDNVPGFIDRSIWDCIYFAIWSKDCDLSHNSQQCYNWMAYNAILASGY